MMSVTRLVRGTMLAGLLSITTGALAQPIAVEVTVSGQAASTTHVNSGADIVVNLGNVSANTLVRIFDSAVGGGTPTSSIGKVTINGTVSSGSPILRVLVAGDNQATFPTIPTDLLDQGAVDFGGSGAGAGLTIQNPTNSSDTSLRDSTRLVIAVTGDVTPASEAGAIPPTSTAMATPEPTRTSKPSSPALAAARAPRPPAPTTPTSTTTVIPVPTPTSRLSSARWREAPAEAGPRFE